MRTVIAIIAGAMVAALLNFALSSQDYVNLIWVVGLALVIADLELAGIVFLVLAGFLFDVMVLGNVGVTSVSGVIGAGVYILAKGSGVTDRAWQKVLWVLVALMVCFGADAVLETLLSERYLGIDLTGYWIRSVAVNAVLVGIVYSVIQGYSRRVGGSTSVKL
jgi:hypothetical protein